MSSRIRPWTKARAGGRSAVLRVGRRVRWSAVPLLPRSSTASFAMGTSRYSMAIFRRELASRSASRGDVQQVATGTCRPTVPHPGLDPLLRGRRVIVHDLPSVGKLPEYEREQAVRSFAVGHRELPAATHEGCVCPQGFDLQIGKLQLAHAAWRVLIALLVAIESLLPTMGNFAPRKERVIGRVPIS